MRRAAVLLSVVTLPVALPAGAAAPVVKVAAPYFASISASKARMRTGPARTYPASWLYQRQDLPVRVLASFKEWRRIEDPDGTQGWMQANLLSSTRTAIVRAATPIAMLEQPGAGARLKWHAAPGVVGRISQCAAGWCRFDVKGQAAYVEATGLWGLAPGETLP